MAYATKAQYDARYPGRTVGDAMLDECLEDASTAIDVALEGAGIDVSDVSEDMEDRMMRVCRSVANRMVPAGTDVPVGVTQASITAVGFTQSYSYGTTYGTPKLLKSELALLGISGSAYRSVLARTAGDGDGDV